MFNSLSAACRLHQMLPSQNWESVWPAPRTFHPSVVPLPVRQGHAHLKNQVTPSKWANVELMKVPNFLHLTPPAVARQCAAIKKFCTPWPDRVDVRREYVSLRTTSTYLNAGSSVRDHRARVVTVSTPLSALPTANKEKLLRLVRHR